MARHKYWISHLCFIVHVILFSCLVSDTTGHEDVHEKIKYHLRELTNGLQELDNSKGHSIHKRSTLPHDEMIYNSLVAFCTELAPGHGSSNKTKRGAQHTSSTPEGLKGAVIPGPQTSDVPETSPISTWPHLFPTKVQAQRDGDDVWLLFEIIHTGPVFVTSVHSFDVKRAVIDHPDKLPTESNPSKPSAVISQFRTKIDASVCEHASRPYDDHSANIGFSLSEKQQYVVTTDINLCMFDYFLNETEDGEEIWDAKEKQIFTEQISPPFFQVSSRDPGDEMVLHRGSDAAIELFVHIKDYLGMELRADIWDRRHKGKILWASNRLAKDNGTAKVFPAESNFEQELILVEILEQTDMKSSRIEKESDTDSGGDQEDNVIKVKIRVTIRTSPGKRSGKLTLSYFRHFPSGNNKQNVLRFLTVARVILLKLPHKASVLPKNHVVINTPSDNFKCDNNGIRHYPKHGKNCTIHCTAYGTDISDIFISDTRSGRPPPIKSVSQVYPGATSAFAMIDVGPATKDVEGTYRCTALTSNGKKKRQDLKLYTSLFTEVFHNISIFEFDNFTTRIVCTAFGEQPLNMSLEADTPFGSRNRVDNETTSTRNIDIVGHYSNLTVLLPTIQIMHTDIYCSANSERGASGVAMNTLGYLEESTVPKINQDPKFSKVMSHTNGTVEITCEGRGEEPLDFLIMSGKGQASERLDKLPGTVRTITDTPRGKMLRAYIRKEHTPNPNWTACRVNNTHGEVWYELHTPYQLKD